MRILEAVKTARVGFPPRSKETRLPAFPQSFWWDGTIKDYKTCKDCAEVGELLECYGLGEMYEQLWDCELIGKDEEDEGKVISLDDRLEVVSQYPNLRVKIKC